MPPRTDRHCSMVQWRASVPESWVADHFLQEMLPEQGVRFLVGDESILAQHQSPRAETSLGLGAPRGVAQLIETVRQSGGGLGQSVHLARGTWELLSQRTQAALDLPGEDDWDWLHIHHLPVVNGMDRVSELHPVDDFDLISSVQRRSIPDTYLQVDAVGARWFGWFDDTGQVRAIGGSTGSPARAHLGSIGTLPAWRGRGIGSDLTAEIVADAFNEGLTCVSLGVWAHNTRAIEMYHRLGFHTAHRIHSRRRKSRGET